MRIIEETEFGTQVVALLTEHLEQMAAESPAESMHALALDDLQSDDITVWSMWSPGYCGDDLLMGLGALKILSEQHGELKSMRTSLQFLRQGVAATILNRIVREATTRGYSRLSLETGSMASFQPAVKLYKKYGFSECEPFADYKPDPNSLFLTKSLDGQSTS